MKTSLNGETEFETGNRVFVSRAKHFWGEWAISSNEFRLPNRHHIRFFSNNLACSSMAWRRSNPEPNAEFPSAAHQFAAPVVFPGVPQQSSPASKRSQSSRYQPRVPTPQINVGNVQNPSCRNVFQAASVNLQTLLGRDGLDVLSAPRLRCFPKNTAPR